MSIPLGHDLSPLACIIIIKEFSGDPQFQYEMPQVVTGTPLQQFQFKGGTLIRGINTDHGSFDFDITDNDESLTDKSILSFPSRIKQGWEIELYLGKSPTTVNLWYRGIIHSVKSIKQTNTNTVTVKSYGYGILLASRYSSINRTQQKLTDGITPDPTDNTTKVTQLFKDVLLDTDHLEVPGLGLLDIIPGDIDDLPLKLGDYRKNLVTLGSILNELAQMIGAVWGVDPDKTVFLHQRGSKDSGFLITNDVVDTSLLTNNWDQEKLAFIKSSQLTQNDSSLDSAITTIIGIGSQRQIVDHNKTADDNAVFLEEEHHAFLIEPKKDNISQISLFLVRAAPITEGLIISIVGENKAIPGTPDFTDLRETKIFPKELLEKQLAPPVVERYVDIKFNKIPVTKGEILFIVIKQTTNPVTFLSIPYLEDEGTYFVSSDLENWGDAISGEAKLITYQSKTVKIRGQNTTTQKFLRPKEQILTLPDKPDEQTVLAIMESALESRSKIIRNYDPITITPTTLPIKIGQCIRYRDVNSGFDRVLDVVGFSLTINAYDKNNLGATEMKLDLQEIYI